MAPWCRCSSEIGHGRKPKTRHQYLPCRYLTTLERTLKVVICCKEYERKM
ncbi:hypothetical protein MtrunA17_Chr5g0441091 [Medicago truncatula]|uniref:Uncharacterized protein n=1 Tax=Medicago truncatula TaxID=3880 RepID=A0A396I019_MEDTR|nr:hypothetical protein MtrunA17_Chr5g0441091 [Medicago truncatula]